METTQSCFADSAPIYALDKSEISQSVADGAPGGTISASEAPRLLSLKEALDRPEHDPPHLCNWQKNRIVEAIKEKHLAFDPVKLSKNSDVGILVCQRIWSCWASMDRIHRTLAMRMVLSWLQDRAEEEGVDGTSTLDTTRFNIRAPSDPLSPIQQSSFGLLQTKLGEEKQGNKDGQTEGFSTSPKPKTQGASVELRSVENSADESAPVPRYGAPAKATSQEPLIDRRNGDQITVWRATQDYISGSPSKQVLVAGQHYTKLEEFSVGNVRYAVVQSIKHPEQRNTIVPSNCLALHHPLVPCKDQDTVLKGEVGRATKDYFSKDATEKILVTGRYYKNVEDGAVGSVRYACVYELDDPKKRLCWVPTHCLTPKLSTQS